jgi:hypothetical protein
LATGGLGAAGAGSRRLAWARRDPNRIGADASVDRAAASQLRRDSAIDEEYSTMPRDSIRGGGIAMRKLSLWVALLALSMSGRAWAQEGDVITGDPPPPDFGTEPEVEPEDDEGPIEDPEIPGGDHAAITAEDLEGGPIKKKATPRYDKKTYPTELVKRPLTLAANQFELRLDSPFANNEGNGATMWQVLYASFGVTRDLQVGLTYSFGLIRLDAAEGENGFEVGRGFSFDGAFTIVPNHFAIGVNLPFYVDPDAFAMGVNLSLPFRINFGERWAVYGGHDLFQLGVIKMPVDPTNPGYNLAIAAVAAAEGVEEPTANLNIRAGGMYQVNPNVAAWIEMGIHYPDFEQLDQPTSLFAGASWSRNNRLDLGGRLGFVRLDEAGSFSMSVYAALRL